ncbi:phosphoribosylamine--glycine ligase [Catalinimonas alkaloidigena]|uniref:phosphoribosylamine--glycine ligase n=1 Tax=Catalinimonas alkaloidigena TaxID=1075417 RepID=UPI002405DE49|nr:phosphoribosylamine--glycine ligase [Catalinimonas alkaloidigena]MDF9797371.1 phosphoribosylamine--glycine ligase [Catalinimonas alkaloidigena]
MNVLILGSGGREHALAWKISQSPECDQLFVAPGNAGTLQVATNIPELGKSFDSQGKHQIGEFITKHDIQLLVVGPEAPLVAGITDYLKEHEAFKELAIVGPDMRGATLEGSKDFAKEFMLKNKIPTAASRTFTIDNIEEGLKFIQSKSLPIVLKADGLAAGKGVIISQTYEDAQANLKDMLLNDKFGSASNKVVIEDYLKGIELSVFVLTDGKDYLILPEAKDYKRIGENDTGPNTGGMGAVSPVPFADENFLKKVEERIVKPTIKGLQAAHIDYRGFLFIGLMNVNGDPFVIEYNVRMGDPETQVVVPRIENDILPILFATANQRLASERLKISKEIASTVVMVAEGYPDAYQKGKEITGITDVSEALVFHAGTRDENEKVLTNGGRVLAVTGTGKNIQEALDKSYSSVQKIVWDGYYYRKDIGQDLLTL